MAGITDQSIFVCEWGLAAKCRIMLVALAALCIAFLQPARSEDRDTAAEAVTNLKAYAAFKMGHHDEARRIWEGLAKKGNTTALLNLANMFQQAQGVDEDQKKALTYVRKGAELGDSRAQYELGMAYERGILVERNLQQAAAWFEKAARQGDVDAQFALGVMNATGFGQGTKVASEAQREQAVAWLGKASAQGHQEAATYLELLNP
jgi:hypothetical protein